MLLVKAKTFETISIPEANADLQELNGKLRATNHELSYKPK